MREIEFRAKKTENGKWVYGYYHKLNESFEDKDCILEHHRNTSTIIDVKTLGQYAGLKDKNGTKIFEGDIVKGNITSAWAKEEIICCVEYQKDSFVCIQDDKWKHKLMFAKNIEVIGNIYDNPELLEVNNA